MAGMKKLLFSASQLVVGSSSLSSSGTARVWSLCRGRSTAAVPSVGDLLGTFETIFSGLRHLNDLSIRRSKGTACSTNIVMNLGIGTIVPLFILAHSQPTHNKGFDLQYGPLGPWAQNLPGDHDHKVHDVPHAPEVAAGVEDEALRQDLEGGLHGEYAEEVGLGGL